MPYLGSTPAEKALEADDIASDAVTTAKIANDAVDITKINLVSTSSVPSLEAKGDGSSDGYIQLNCSQNSHGIKLKSPPHSAGQSYTLTFPSSVTNDYFLKTDGSGNLSFAAVAGGGFEFIDSTNVTAVTSIAFTDLADGYDYLFQIENIDGTEDSSGIYFQLGVAGPTYRTSGYLMNVAGVRGTGTAAAQVTNYGVVLYTGEGTGSNEHLYFSETMVLNPADASTKTTTFGHNIYYNYQPLACSDVSGGRYDTAEAHTAIRFYQTAHDSVNFSAGGTIRRYRRSRT